VRAATVRVIVDRDKCSASGLCVLSAPDVFRQDEEGVAGVIQPDPPPERREIVESAVRNCPAGAIRIEEE
jgi:ferredoxin